MSNKKLYLGLAVGVLLGVLLTMVIVFNQAPKLMIIEDESAYDFATTTSTLEEAVKNAGWSIPTVHDMQKTLKGFGHEIDEVKIYELCSSKYSAIILAEDEGKLVSPMMPCRIAVYVKSDGKTYIGRMNSALVAKMYGGIIDEVMQKAFADTEVILKQVIK